MQRAVITGIVVSLLTGIISVFVVMRRVAFVGSGISHAAFGGVAIGFLAVRKSCHNGYDIFHPCGIRN